jgi:hypothetical protein
VPGPRKPPSRGAQLESKGLDHALGSPRIAVSRQYDSKKNIYSEGPTVWYAIGPSRGLRVPHKGLVHRGLVLGFAFSLKGQRVDKLNRHVTVLDVLALPAHGQSRPV